MILNKGEVILWHDMAEGEECLSELHETGYKIFLGAPLVPDNQSAARGVRWSSRYEFPNCISMVDDELVDWLLDGKAMPQPYGDRGENYAVRWWGESESVSVEDLL